MEFNEKKLIDILKVVNESEYGYLNLVINDLDLTVVKKGMDLGELSKLIQPSTKVTPTENYVGTTGEVAATTPAVEIKKVVKSSEAIEPPTPTVPATASDASAETHYIVKSPMLGTFFSRPSPEEPPFVEIGDIIEENGKVCLIEIMKLFNTISSDVNGRVVDILVTDGEMVEYDQPLFVIEPIK